jgi:hypothetical protein
VNTTTLGTVGERLVEAELLKLGFCVARPAVDIDGYDLLAGTDAREYHRIQIKTCRVPAEYKGSYGYRYTALKNKKSDYFIFVCLMHNTFYIVPTNLVAASIRLSGDGSGQSELEKFFGAWHILKPASDDQASAQVADA